MAKDRKTSVHRKRNDDKSAQAKHSPAEETSTSTATADTIVSVSGNSVRLTVGEINILAVFRKYLMTPGRMLCLNNTDIGTMKRSLDKLIASGLLIPEDFKGSYSLTRSGFQAMNELS